MSQEFDDILNVGMDASDFIAGGNAIEKTTQKITAQFRQLLDQMLKTDKIAEQTSQTFTQVDEAGRRITQTFKKTEDGWKALPPKILVNVNALKSYIDTVSQTDDKLTRLGVTLERVYSKKTGEFTGKYREVQLPAPLKGWGNEEKQSSIFADAFKTEKQILATNEQINSTIETQNNLHRLGLLIQKSVKEQRAEELKLAAEQVEQEAKEAEQARLLAEISRISLEETNRLNVSLAEQKQLVASITRETRERVDAEKEARLLSANNLGASLYSRTTSGKDLDVASLQRINSLVNSVSKEVEKGAIGVERAEEIIGNVLRGESQYYAGAEAKVASFVTRIRQANGELTGLDTKQLQVSLKETKAVFGDTEEAAVHATNRISLSWEGMVRLLEVQLLHTAIRAFLDSLRDSIEETAKFEQRISEIRTISQDSIRTTQEWSSAIEELSNRFGSPVLDVAEATYQALSSQLVNSANAADFVAKNMEFARVTMTDAATATNLVTSALKAYGETASSQDMVLSDLFKTITVGKLRAEDLAQAFGRSAPFAKELGLSMREALAAIATFTQSGMTVNEAGTLLNNGLNKLISPSKEMKEIFDELHVSTGEAAIAMYGFPDLLARIAAHTHDSASEIGKLERDLRAIRFEVGLSGQGLQLYNTTLAKYASQAKDYGQAVKLAFESPAVELQKFGDRAKNFLREDWARPTLDAIVRLGHAIGGDDGLIGAFKGLVNWGIRAIEVYTAYRAISGTITLVENSRITTLQFQEKATRALENAENARTNALNLSMKSALLQEEANIAEAEGAKMAAASIREEALSMDELAASSIRLAESEEAAATANQGLIASMAAFLTSPAVLLTAGVAAIAFLYGKARDYQRELQDSAEKAGEAAAQIERGITEATAHEVQLQQEVWEKGLNRRFAAFDSFANDIATIIKQNLEEEELAAHESVETTKQQITEYIRLYEEGTSKVESLVKEALSNIERAQEEQNSLAERYADEEFARQMRIAEFQDRISDGTNLHRVDDAQLKLIAQETTQLDTLNKKLAQPTGDPKLDAANSAEIQKNLSKESKTQDDLLEHRMKLEEEQANNAKKILEIQTRITEQKKKADLDREKEQNRDREGQAREMGEHSHRFDSFRDKNRSLGEQGIENRDNTEVEHLQQELELLEKRQKLLDSTLKTIPTITDSQKEQVAIQQRANQALIDYIKLQNDIVKKDQEQVEKRNAAFKELRTQLELIAKFKENTKPFTKQEDADRYIAQFQTLTDKAESLAQGLSDSSKDPSALLNSRLQMAKDFANERAEMEKKANLQIEQAKLDAARETEDRIRKEMIESHKQQEQLISDSTQAAAQAAQRIHGIIGKDFKTPGSLGTFADPSFRIASSGLKNPDLPSNMSLEDLDKQRQSALTGLLSFEQEMTAAGNEGRKINLSGLDVASKQIRDYIKMFEDIDENKIQQLTQLTGKTREQVFLSMRGNQELPSQRTIRTGEVDSKTGKEVTTTLADELQNLRTALTSLSQQALARNLAFEAIKKTDNDADARLKALAPDLKILGESTLEVGKQFNNLTDELRDTISRIIEIKNHLPATLIRPAGHANGGWINWTPQGTDRVPAMLTPGEYVVDKDTATRHAALLQNLKYYEEGGSVEAELKPGSIEYMRKLYGLPPKSNVMDAQSGPGSIEYMRKLYGLAPKANYDAKLRPSERPGTIEYMRKLYGLPPKANYGVMERTYHPWTPQPIKPHNTITFGNIVIHLNSTGKNELDGKAIVAEIQRELRRTGAQLHNTDD